MFHFSGHDDGYLLAQESQHLSPSLRLWHNLHERKYNYCTNGTECPVKAGEASNRKVAIKNRAISDPAPLMYPLVLCFLPV